MMKKTKGELRTVAFVAFFIFANCAVARADSLFRLFPEAQVNGFYGDNIPFKTNNQIGDFGTTMVAGFYLDFTSAARYSSLHYDTFAQLFTHQTRFDRAGQGQYVALTDDENLSQTTKLHFSEYFYRDAPGLVAVTTSDQSPQFNSVLALLLLANDQASINQFNAQLTHYWGRQWSSELSVHQTTFFSTGGATTSSPNNESFGQSVSTITDYHFSNRFSLGVGYRYYDFRFTFPGRPGEQAHWPFIRATWEPTSRLYLSGIGGVVISHTQGQSGNEINAGGIGQIAYRFARHGEANISGGQEPTLTSAFGTVGFIRGVRGNIRYDFTSRLTGTVGGSYYNLTGTGFSGNFASWGVGLSQRVNKWLSINTRFIQIRRQETGSSQFIPSSNQNGQWATGNYYIVGLAVSGEAFRWSWQ
jgi:hypothetical protein